MYYGTRALEAAGNTAFIAGRNSTRALVAAGNTVLLRDPRTRGSRQHCIYYGVRQSCDLLLRSCHLVSEVCQF